MTKRLPHTGSKTEVRQAFGRLNTTTDVITTGAIGYVLVGAGTGVTPTWTTDLTELTSLVVDDITINGAAIVSGTGAISFGDDDISTTGTITGVNVTSGADPGHTHGALYYTETELDAGQLDNRYFTESEHVDASTGAPDAGKPVKLNASGLVDATMVPTGDHGALTGLADDDHTQYHNDTRAATWLAANHETTYPHTGASGSVPVGAGVGTPPVWGTSLTALTMLTVDNISVNGAAITSDTGEISFDNENLTTTGKVTANQFASPGTLYLLPGTDAPIQLTTDGDTRGVDAVDLQVKRTASTQVASGDASFACGRYNTAGGVGCACFGLSNTINSGTYYSATYGRAHTIAADYCVAMGRAHSISGQYSLAFGYANTVSSGCEYAMAIGTRSLVSYSGQVAQATGRFGVNGDAQRSDFVLWQSTTDATATEMFIDGTAGTQRLTLPNSTGWAFNVRVVAKQTATDWSINGWEIGGVISRPGSGNAVILGQTTIWSAIGDASATLTISADTTNQSLKLGIQGIAGETWHWVAVVSVTQVQ